MMKKLVLTVDDSKTVRKVIAASLINEGYQVIEATDGEDALQKMNIFNFNLIVTDLHMPKMDGIAFIRNVRRNATTRFTPIIMLSSEGKDEVLELGKKAGASGWITKPFNPKQLSAVVKIVAGSSH